MRPVSDDERVDTAATVDVWSMLRAPMVPASDCTVLFRPDSPDTVWVSPETDAETPVRVDDKAAMVEAVVFWAAPIVSTEVDRVCTVLLRPESPAVLLRPSRAWDRLETVEDRATTVAAVAFWPAPSVSKPLERVCTVLLRPEMPETVVDSPDTVEDRVATVEAVAFWAEPSVSTVVDRICTVLFKPKMLAVLLRPDSPDTVDDKAANVAVVVF